MRSDTETSTGVKGCEISYRVNCAVGDVQMMMLQMNVCPESISGIHLNVPILRFYDPTSTTVYHRSAIV
jgi:hypothetical protein